MISGVSWRLFSPEEKTTNTKNAPQNPTKIRTQMKENPWAFWFYFLTCCLNSLFDEEWASADHPQDTTTGEAQNCPTGIHSHPAPAGLALGRRILPEKDPQPALLPLPAAADWGFWSVLLLVGFFFFLLSCLLVLSMKSCGLVLAPGDSLAEIPAGIGGSWQLGTGGWVQAVLQSPGPVVQAGILMPSNAAIPLFAFPSAGFHLLEPVWKPGTFLLWLTQNPEEFFEMMALGMNHSRL